MFQALALASIGSRKYKVHASATDEFIIPRASRRGRDLEQLSVDVEGHVDAANEVVDVDRAGTIRALERPRDRHRCRSFGERERIAVLAALNLAFALAERPAPVPVARAHEGMNRAGPVDIDDLVRRIDMTLNVDGQLL